MGVGSLLCKHFALVEQADPGQPGIHQSPGLGQPTQSTLGWLVHTILVASYAGSLVDFWLGQ